MRTAARAALWLPFVLLCLSATVEAAVFNVTIYDDVSDATPDGTCDSCSLREAIQEANLLPGPDTINLPPGTYTMDIPGADEDLGASGDLDITDDVTIIGIGTTRIESHVGRILHVHEGNVSITGLTLLQGDANNDQASGRAGGAVYNAPASTLTLNACAMTINQAQGGGGAIYNGGTLSLNGSTLTTNSAVGNSRGGAVYNNGTMIVTNCSLNGNSSTDGSGGIYSTASSILRVNNSTIAENASTGGIGGGGLKAEAGCAIHVTNTLIANNSASGPNDDCEASLTSSGGNMVMDADGCSGLGTGDITSVDPLLGPLQNNGGRTLTRAPLPASQALETGGTVGACELTDQRGLSRPQGVACDRGAVELFPACPVIALTPTTLLDAQAGAFYSQTVVPAGGVPPYRFAVTADPLPDGLALDPVNGVLSGDPTGSGGVNFRITAFDANFCSGSFDYTLNVLSGPSCSPAIIDISPTQLPMAMPGEDYSQTLTATGGTAPHLYTVTDGQLPPGLGLDPVTGRISGTPTVSGTFVFVGTATDASTCTGDQGYSLQVPCTFSFSPTALPAGREGTPYLQTLAVSTGGTPPYAFAVVTSSLPPGLSLSGPGVLSGTPSMPGTYAFLLEATDANFCTGKVGHVLVVDPCIEIVTDILPQGVVGSAYAATLTATGGSGPISFSISSGTLPSGVDFDASGNFTGVASTPGTYFFTVEATDGSCSVPENFYLVVNPAGCPAITILPATLPGDTVGSAMNQNLSGNGGSSPYTFQLVAGTLPDGISLSAGGHLSGTFLSSGFFTFTIAATDGNGCAGTRSDLMLIAPSVCPEISLFPPVLPDGTRSVEYQQTVLATGGIAPCVYSVSAGGLPPGLTLDPVTGALSGRPSELGEFAVTLTATDATACAGSANYAMEIRPDFRGANCTLFGDTFENDLLAVEWTYLKPSWSESGGSLVGTAGKKAIAIASPSFAGCLNCAVEGTLQTSKAGTGKVSLLGWYADKKNYMELSASAGTDVWLLKQRAAGKIVAKAKASKPMDPNVPYLVRVVFDGTKFDVFVDDLETPLMSLTPKKAVPAGTVGFQASGATGTFGYLCVN